MLRPVILFGLTLSTFAGQFQSLYFEPNQGQFSSPARFLARQGRHSLFITDTGSVSVLDGASVLRMTLAGAQPASSVTGEAPTLGRSNYLTGDKQNWVTDVPHYSRVLLRDVYPSIDLVYYTNGADLEYDFIVHPGADPSRIRIDFSGASPEIAPTGDLILKTASGELRNHKPRVYQSIDGRQVEIPSAYSLKDGQVAFTLASYDAGLPLVIDPPITYLTYLGGSGSEGVPNVQADGAGNAYVIGTTRSSNFPTLNSFAAFVNDVGFVTKYNATGQVVYSTFLGITGIATAAVNTSGEMFLFFEKTGDGSPRIAKLNAAGNALSLDFNLSGGSNIVPRQAVADAAGNVYACGDFNSGTVRNLPVTANALHSAAPISGSAGTGFLMKFNSAGTVQFATFLPMECRMLAIDASGNSYVGGASDTTQTAWPITATFGTAAGTFSAMVGKVNATGSALTYASHLRAVTLRGLAVDSAGALYVGGSATTGAALQSPIRDTFSGNEGYLAKIHPNGASLVWGTLVGGSSSDTVEGIAVTPDSKLFFMGETSSTNLAVADATQATNAGGGDLFVGQVNAEGTAFPFLTYLGGTLADSVSSTKRSIVIDDGAIYVAGSTASTNLPVVNAAQGSYGGGTRDSFIVKYGTTIVPDCIYTLGASSVNIAAAGGASSVSVTTQPGCVFTAITSDGFITITGGTPGNGSGNINFSVAVNAGSARSGSILIAGQTFTVNQAAASAPPPPPPGGPAPSNLSPRSGSATSGTFTFTFTSPSGFAALTVVNVLINNAIDGRNACYIAFVPSGPTAGSLFLVDDAGNAGGPYAGIALPSTGTASNSQCTINGSGSSVSGSGNNLTLTLNITFKTPFAGNRIFYMAAQDNSPANSGWKPLGTWNVPGAAISGPSVGVITPGYITNATQTISFALTHSAGFASIAVANILINDAIDGRNACYLAYVPSGPSSGSLFLVDDAGNAGGPYAGMTLPSSGTVSNSQCTVEGTGSSVTSSGTTTTLNLKMTFKPAFAGYRIIFPAVRSTTQNSDWQPRGLVNVP
jgi:hypothetical protein